MNDSLMRFDGVSLGYGRKTVLSGISFSIDRGDFIGVVGPNGAGKTTLLRGILGLLKPRAGVVQKPRTLRFGYVPQSNTIDDIFPFTAGDIVSMGLYPRLPLLARPGEAHQEKVRDMLEKVGMGEYLRTLYRDLSGGLRQRVLIARALVADPDILVLDEPTNDLDIAGEKAVMDLIKSLHEEQGITVVMVSHLLNVVINYAEKIGFVDTVAFEIRSLVEAIDENMLRKIYRANVRVVTAGGKRVVTVE